jgi:two-component system cell cycle response regulator
LVDPRLQSSRVSVDEDAAHRHRGGEAVASSHHYRSSDPLLLKGPAPGRHEAEENVPAMPALTLDHVLECPRLPSLSNIAIQILELTRNHDANLDEIARVIQNDQALTAKILRTVNSSFFGLARPCPTISRAIAYLGLTTVKSLVLGFSVVDITRGAENGFDFIAYWRRGLYSAAAARRIAARGEASDPEEAFIVALIQDVGMLALHAANRDRYREITDAAGDEHAELADLEERELGFDHATVGARLCESWRLPSQFITAVETHHDPQPPSNAPLVRELRAAGEIAAAIASPDPQAMLAKVRGSIKQTFGFTRGDFDDLMRQVVEDVEELRSLFEVNAGDPPNVERLLAQAEKASIEHQIEMHRQTESLRRENTQLIGQTTTDSLTNVGNRKRFDELLARLFEHAKRRGRSLGLIIADADEFKVVNDEFGHQIGDSVLVELAHRLERAAPDPMHVCRYGGEEFGVILPEATRRDAAQVAQTLCDAVAEAPMTVYGASDETLSVPVTVSLGVAVMEPDQLAAFPRAELLVQAADRALYAAKAGGGNCARIFRMRTLDAA